MYFFVLVLLLVPLPLLVLVLVLWCQAPACRPLWRHTEGSMAGLLTEIPDPVVQRRVHMGE